MDVAWRAPKTRITPAPGPVTNSELATFLVEAQACINDAWSEPLNRVLTTPSNEKGGETKKGETTNANRKAEIPLVDGQPKVTANGTGGSTKRSPESGKPWGQSARGLSVLSQPGSIGEPRDA